MMVDCGCRRKPTVSFASTTCGMLSSLKSWQYSHLKMLYRLLKTVFWLLKLLLIYFSLAFATTTVFRFLKTLWGRQNLRPISGKDAVLITGATSGIGLAVAKHLYKLGFSVIVGYYDSKEIGYVQLKQLSEQKQAGNGEQRMLFVELDVRDDKSIFAAHALSQEWLNEHKINLYALINNAGIGSLQPFGWLPRQKIKNLLNTNLTGSVMMTREFLPQLIHSRGRILNISSALGLIPGPNYCTYGITKTSMLYFTHSLNYDLKTHGVKSVAIMLPNLIKDTSIMSSCVKTIQSAWEEATPEERQLYKAEYEEQLRMARGLEEATKEQARKAAETPRRGKAGGLWEQVKPLGLSLSQLFGNSKFVSLEDSGFLKGFEDALRLENPHELYFAGDNIFSYVIGPILLVLPPCLTKLLSHTISSNLYK